MKQLALIVCLMAPIFCWSQSTDRHSTDAILITNAERLNLDFEVKNNSNPDLTTLQQINLDQYEAIRAAHVDVEVFDVQTGYTLIIYSKTKVLNQKKLNDNQTLYSLPNNQH